METLFPNLSTPLWCDIPFTKREEKARQEYLTTGEGAEILSRIMKEMQCSKPMASAAVPRPSPTKMGSDTLILHNIPRDLTEEEIQFEFGCYGTLTRIRIPLDKDPKSPFYGGVRGFAILQFKTASQAETAYQQENGRLTIRGKTLTIEQVEPKSSSR